MYDPLRQGRILTSCSAYTLFHEELSKAADNNLLRHFYSAVQRAGVPPAPRILRFKGSIQFHSPALHGAINDHYDARNSECTTQQEFVDRASVVAKHIIAKYGKYLVDTNFGPGRGLPQDYEMTYTWNSIIP